MFQKFLEGMGTWLAVLIMMEIWQVLFQRPNLMPILDLINEKGR